MNAGGKALVVAHRSIIIIIIILLAYQWPSLFGSTREIDNIEAA
jgi:hypothetical protein